MTRILCTGASGFIGSNLVKRLDELNHEVVCVDKSPKSDRTVKLDVATEEFTKYFKNQQFDTVIHLGSPCSIILFNDNPTYYENNTYNGFRNIIKLAEKCGAKLIYPSSGNIYGHLDKPHSETDELRPVNIYGMCKLWCEYLVNANKINSTGLRIYCGYGDAEETKGSLASVLYKFIKNMRIGMTPTIWGNGFQTRDFIYIDDITEGFVKAMDLNGKHLINIASGTSTNYNDLVKLINKVLNTDIIPNYIAKPEVYVEKTSANINKMKKLLGITPKPLEDGIKLFIKYLQK